MRPGIQGYAMAIAVAASSRSEDPRRKVGAAVLSSSGEVLSTGYNGPPSGVDLDPLLWLDRELARAVTIHAEANALRYVRPGEGWLLASTYEPCIECLKAARAQGIFLAYYREPAAERWRPDPFHVSLLGMSVQQADPTPAPEPAAA